MNGVNIRVQEKVRRELKSLAGAKGMTMSKAILFLIEYYRLTQEEASDNGKADADYGGAEVKS